MNNWEPFLLAMATRNASCEMKDVSYAFTTDKCIIDKGFDVKLGIYYISGHIIGIYMHQMELFEQRKQ